MSKTILVTGSTDGIGLETAKTLAKAGHNVLLHGRNPSKLANAERLVLAEKGGGRIETYVADLSRISAVSDLANSVTAKHKSLDVLINNAGVLKTSTPLTPDGLDARFAVNSIAPYLLTKLLLPILVHSGRVVNLGSAAQAPVDLGAFAGKPRLDHMPAYSQSKLAITMWSRSMARKVGKGGPMIVTVNPGSFLASKMVREGFGVAGSDLGQGAEILCRAALGEEFAKAGGKYFDNDSGRFAKPHPAGREDAKCDEIVRVTEEVLEKVMGKVS